MAAMPELRLRSSHIGCFATNVLPWRRIISRRSRGRRCASRTVARGEPRVRNSELLTSRRLPVRLMTFQSMVVRRLEVKQLAIEALNWTSGWCGLGDQ